MHKVLISLASNRFQKRNLQRARHCLETLLQAPRYTSELWTLPIGSKRNDHYINQLVEASTTLGFDELCLSLKKIETDFGRTDEKRAMGIVPIDLDVLRFDDQLLHLRDWERPYVKNLISEL